MTLRLPDRVGLVGGDEHPHAARRLRSSWPALDWIDVDDGRVFDFPTVELRTDRAIPEGAFDRVVSTIGQRLQIIGGPFSGVIGGVENLIAEQGESAFIELDPGRLSDRPALLYRTLWTWDHSTNWDLGQIGAQETGVFNPYGKPPGGFLADYRAMVDFCSRHRISAIVIYGFLRDSHGGIESAAELCRYANERGVRIVPGIAIGAYGGVYWEGDHTANLASWLRSHPEHAASIHGGVGFTIADLGFALSFPRSDYTLAACPSRPETLAWMQDSVAWLAETFDIGGINIESGDYGVCGCERCVSRRGAVVSGAGESWSHDDLLANFPPLDAVARARRDDLWITCELQWDNVLDASAHRRGALPEQALYQHTANRSYFERLCRELTAEHVSALPYRSSALRLHLGSQWNGGTRTERHAFVGHDLARAAQTVVGAGMQGLTIWGEASPYTGSNELNYLAFSEFSRDPSLSWHAFRARVVDPLLGGEDAADEYLAITAALDETVESTALPALLARTRAHASSVAGVAASDRWWRLADRLDRRVFTNHLRSLY